MGLLSIFSRSNWNLEMLVFVDGGKPEKNPWSRDENQQQTQSTYGAKTGNRTRVTLVGGECSHHCAIPAPTKIPQYSSLSKDSLNVLKNLVTYCSNLKKIQFLLAYTTVLINKKLPDQERKYNEFFPSRKLTSKSFHVEDCTFCFTILAKLDTF